MVAPDKLNYINVGPYGTFRESGNYQTLPGDIDNLFVELTDRQSQKLIVHLHGGLVSETGGMDTAKSMADALNLPNAHTVTFVWETGLIETLQRNLARIHKTKLFKKLLAYAIKKLFGFDNLDAGARGGGQEPELTTILVALDQANPLEGFTFPVSGDGGRGSGPVIDRAITDDELVVLENELTGQLEEEMEADLELQDLLVNAEATEFFPSPAESRQPGTRGLVTSIQIAKKIAMVVIRTLKRFLNGTDHGAYPTIVEEVLRGLYLADLGAFVWDGMKQAASDMWLPNREPVTPDSHAGTYFLHKLNQHMRENDDFHLHLIGHSAGSIAICHMLGAVSADPALSIIPTTVSFLAPACTHELFKAEMWDHQDRFGKFRMFTMSDNAERKDRLMPYIYTRSLLYFISGVLEPSGVDKPLLGMQRYQSAGAPYDVPPLLEITDWLCDPTVKRQALSPTDETTPVGMQTTSLKHGDFDNDQNTLLSLSHIISQ